MFFFGVKRSILWARLLEDGLDIDKRAGCPGEGGNLSLRLAKIQNKHSIDPLPKMGSNCKNIIMNDGCETFSEQKNISPHQHFAEISISSNLLP